MFVYSPLLTFNWMIDPELLKNEVLINRDLIWQSLS